MRAMGWWALVLALGPSATTGDAVALEYSAPADCPDEHEMRAILDEALDSVPTVETRHQVRAVAVVEEDHPSLFRLELEIDDGETVRRRSLTDPSCGELVHTGAVLVAIAVDPRIAAAVSRDLAQDAPPDDPGGTTATGPVPGLRAGLSGSPPSEVGPTGSPAETVLAPTPVATPTRPRVEHGIRSRPHTRWDVAAAGGAGFNLLPGWAASASIILGVQGHRWRVETVAAALPSKRGGTSEASGRFSLATIGVRGCGTFETQSLLFPLCGGLSVGGIRGRAVEIAQASTAWFPWLSAHAGPSVHWRVHPRVRPFAGAELVVPILRGTFVVESAPELIHRPGVVGFSAHAGISISLGGL